MDTQKSGHDWDEGKHSMKSPRWQNRFYRWILLFLLWVFAFYLGISGFLLSAATANNPITPVDAFYMTLQLILLESIDIPGPMLWQLQVARLLLPALTAFSAIDALLLLFSEQRKSLRLRFIRDHVIICGLGRKGYCLARSFCQRGDNVVVIERDENSSLLDPCRSLGATVLIGDASEETTLHKAGIVRARVLIAVASEDGINAEIAIKARNLSASRSRGVLTCIIHLVDPGLCELMRQHEIEASDQHFRLELFNIYDRAARVLLREYPVKIPARQAPSLLVVGLGRLGESLVVHAARDWSEQHEIESQIKITLIDQQANQKSEELTVRNPRLSEVCELTPLDMDVRSPEFYRARFLHEATGEVAVDVVFICLDDDSLGLRSGLIMRQRLAGTEIPILVRMVERGGLSTLLEDTQQDKPHLRAFSLLDCTCTADLVEGGNHEMLARTIHEEYLRAQREQGQIKESNPSMVEWEALPEWLKEANRRQADHIGQKLKRIGCAITPGTILDLPHFSFTDEEIEILSRMEHDRWVDDRRRQGWKYAAGPKDAHRRTHPSMVAWECLPESEKEKDRDTVRHLPALLARTGLQIYRPGTDQPSTNKGQ
jgi:hypothetical protein